MIPRDHRTSRTYFELIEAFGQPDCAVCRVVDAAVLGYIDMFLYENVNNLARRAEIRASRGFCSTHGNLLLMGYGRKQSIAVLQQDIVNDVIQQWEALPEPRQASFFKRQATGTRNFAEQARPQRDCPLCDYERTQEIAVLRTLLDDILDPDMLAAFARSDALCLPHFVMALDLGGVARSHLSKLVEVEQRVVRGIKAQLDEFVHKQNASYDDLAKGDEADAPIRATRLTSGRVHHTDARRSHQRRSQPK